MNAAMSLRPSVRAMTVRLLAVLLMLGCISPMPALVEGPSPDSVGIVLGETPAASGIQARPGDDAAGLRTGVLDGRGYWETNKTEGARIIYFYMDVDDAYLFDNADYDVEITVDYYDEGSGSIVLQYDAHSAPFKDAPLFMYGDTKTWQSHTFRLSDAKFANRTGGADFRLGIEGGGASWQTNADLKLASVTVRKTPKPPAADHVSVTLGDVPVESGISPRAGDNPDGLATGTLDGKTYWRTSKPAGTAYLYMNVDDAYLYDNTDQDVYVTVEYYEQGSGVIVLQYDAESAPFKDAPLFTYGNTGKWKTQTFRLPDAKFANRTNGADFRVGVEGAGAPAVTADLYLASVTVTKKPKVNADPNTKVVETLYPTEDVVIANFDVTDFGAAGDGATDDTQAFQDALDAAGHAGGGVVFAPAGRYRIAGTLTIPTGVTLRGDWRNPEEGGVVGTILQAHYGRGEADETSFIRMQPASGVTHLSVWYPEQSLAQPVPYPWTFEQLSGDSATIANVTLVNAYNGVKIGPVWNELHYVKGLYGTALHTGIFLDFTTDIGRLEHIRLSPDYWADSGLPGAPDRSALAAYMTAQAEGIVMGRSDWEYMSDIAIDGFRTGMRITTRTGSNETANAQLYRIRITNAETALKIEGVNAFGLLVTDSVFEANVGGAPKAIHATSGFTSIAQFNGATVGGDPLHAVVNEGTGVLSFENSTFAAWDGEAGGYALDAAAGSIILGQSAFAQPDRHLRVGEGVETVRAVNSGYGGQLAIDDLSGGAAELDVHQDARYVLETVPAVPALDKPVRPKPATRLLFDVTAAPYGADKTGAADASAAVQQALNDAGAAGGGTVYLPAGIYRVDQPLAVPSGVELRGSWDVPHHTIGGGTVLFTRCGLNDPDGAPFIALQAQAGVRGLSVYYDAQRWDAVQPYAWTIQGQGHGVYAIDTTLINPYQAVDFGTYDTSGHYIDYVAGSPLKEGIFVGGGAAGGFVRNIQFNPHYYARNNYPNHPQTDADFQALWNYQKENLDAFRIGDATGETVFNTFVYGSRNGIHFVGQNGRGAEAVVIGHGTDGSKKGALLESAGPAGLTFINTELVAISTSDKVYVTVGEQFDAQATFFNTSMWGDTTRSFDIYGGRVRIQQSNFTNVGQIGINALGGDITLYDSYFQQAGTTHIYAGPDIDRMVVTNNLFNGGLAIVNDAPAKVTGTNIVPIELDLLKTAFNPKDAKNTNLSLKLTNLSVGPSASGRIELLRPAAYAGALTPIRFEGLAVGESLTVPLPYLAADMLEWRVTLDDGTAYVMSGPAGQSFAARRKGGKPAAPAPAVRLDEADHYASLGGAWRGPDDLSAAADVTWDDRKIYFRVTVKDDVHAPTGMGGDIWQGDSVQIALDLTRKDGAASRNVSELGFALGEDGAVRMWRWRAPEGVAAGPLQGVQAGAERDEAEGVTVYDITIPFSVLHGPDHVFSPRDPIGFALLVNENDGAGRSGFMEYNQGIGASKDAGLFGDLFLLTDDYGKLLEKTAAAAVDRVKKGASVTTYDAAANFVRVLPDGKTKTKLMEKLEKAWRKA